MPFSKRQILLILFTASERSYVFVLYLLHLIRVWTFSFFLLTNSIYQFANTKEKLKHPITQQVPENFNACYNHKYLRVTVRSLSEFVMLFV